MSTKNLNKIDCTITKNGIIIDLNNLKNILGDTKYKLLKKDLTVINRKVMGRREYITKMILYKIVIVENDTQYFVVSRFSSIKSLILKYNDVNINFINKIQPGIDISDKFLINESIQSENTVAPVADNDKDQNKQPKYKEYVDLEDHQIICLNYLMDNVYNEQRVKFGSASCIFVMDTGLGKTFTAAALIERLKTKTLIIIPNKSNLDGWRDPFKIYLKNLKLGEYHSDKKEDGDAVMMTIDSALGDEFTFERYTKYAKTMPYYEYFKQFGLVIYDEIHNYPTPTQNEIFWRTNFKYGLGLTATPSERADKMDIVYYKHVGKVINAKEIPGFLNYAEELEWKGKITLIEFYGSSKFTETFTNNMGWVNTTEMHKQFSRDPYRTKLIINLIKERMDNGRYIFVFAVHRAFLEELHKNLMADDPKRIVTFMGGATDENKQIAKNDAQVILTTYSFGKESVSIKRMDTIIFAQPMRNRMRQTIGRILRRGGDASIEREIIDIRDMNTPLKSQYSTRKQIYIEKNFPIEKKEIKYQDITL